MADSAKPAARCVGMSRSQRDDEAKAGADDVEARVAALSKHYFQ